MNRAFLLLIFLAVLQSAHAQAEAGAEHTYHFDGSVSITNNGFSFIPTFSLGKPALVADLSMGGDRFSFDPQFRFDLAGLKPWSFIFIWRYKLIRTGRFQLKVGAHLPALSFRPKTIDMDGETKEGLVPYRFITPELIPSYTISEHITLGMYYIYGLGLEKQDQTRHTHFLSLRAYFNRLHLTKQLYLNVNPQFYYLSMDGIDGVYTALSLGLAHGKIPLSITSMMNFKLESEVPSKDFDWNISLVYSFSNRFVKR